MRHDLIRTFALAHHGLVTRAQATTLGVGTSTWYSMVRRGVLEEVAPGVARLPGAPDTPDQRILSAVLSCGGPTKASHRSATHLWVPSALAPPIVDVTIPRTMRSRSLPGVAVHRPRDELDLGVVWRRKIPTTNPLRTLIDLGAVAPDAVKPTFERMIVERLVSPSAVVALLLRHQGPGRHGVTALRAVLEDWTMNELPPDSVLEEAMNDLVLRHRLPPVTFHPVVCGYEPDFIVTGSRILIECDGWATHGLDRRTFEKDRERDADLLAEGYVVIRVTWRQIKFHPGAVARRVRAVIERVAPELLTTRR